MFFLLFLFVFVLLCCWCFSATSSFFNIFFLTYQKKKKKLKVRKLLLPCWFINTNLWPCIEVYRGHAKSPVVKFGLVLFLGICDCYQTHQRAYRTIEIKDTTGYNCSINLSFRNFICPLQSWGCFSVFTGFELCIK